MTTATAAPVRAATLGIRLALMTLAMIMAGRTVVTWRVSDAVPAPGN